MGSMAIKKRKAGNGKNSDLRDLYDYWSIVGSLTRRRAHPVAVLFGEPRAAPGVDTKQRRLFSWEKHGAFYSLAECQ